MSEKACSNCRGTGSVGGHKGYKTPVTCDKCAGTGRITIEEEPTLEDKVCAKFADELYFTDRDGMITIDGSLDPNGLKEFATIITEHFK